MKNMKMVIMKKIMMNIGKDISLISHNVLYMYINNTLWIINI